MLHECLGFLVWVMGTGSNAGHCYFYISGFFISQTQVISSHDTWGRTSAHL
jgi:hypothetical protein